MTSPPTPLFSAADRVDGGELRLPRPPGVIRRFWARHHVAANTILAIVVGLISVVGGLQPANRAGEDSWLVVATIVLIVVGVTGVYIRRTRPLVTVVVGSMPIIALLWAPADTVLVPAVVAVYSVAAYRSARSGTIAAISVWAAATLTAAIGALVLQNHRADLSGDTAVLAFATQFGILTALALAIGINIGNRRRYLAAVIERAHQLAVERDQRGQLATAAERARIAREMHDIVSHSLTVMVALAEGSAVAAAQSAPDAATAMRSVAETGRGAMVDMRRMLGVLGGDGGVADGGWETAPQPGFADLPALIDGFRALDMPVRFRRDGPVPADPAVQLTVYRLVQESLTNALRYARGPTEVSVAITIRGGILTASVTDDGLAGFNSVKGTVNGEIVGSGRGLIGLRERAASIGGTLTAGPRTDGTGWQVQATLPLGDGSEDGRP